MKGEKYQTLNSTRFEGGMNCFISTLTRHSHMFDQLMIWLYFHPICQFSLFKTLIYKTFDRNLLLIPSELFIA